MLLHTSLLRPHFSTPTTVYVSRHEMKSSISSDSRKVVLVERYVRREIIHQQIIRSDQARIIIIIMLGRLHWTRSEGKQNSTKPYMKYTKSFGFRSQRLGFDLNTFSIPTAYKIERTKYLFSNPYRYILLVNYKH